MATSYETARGKVRLGAGTAFKAGFFGALGVFVFYLVLTVVLGVLALVAAAFGILPVVGRLFER